MIKGLVTILFITLSVFALAGEIKTVSINYEYVSDNSNESLAQAKQTALQRAKLKAMEEHFGLDVSSVSNILQRNKQIGKESTSSTDVFSLRETAVRGEWIETITEKVDEPFSIGGFLHVKVYVKGKARNNDKPKVEVKYALINNAHDRDNRDQYYDGDDIFLRFSTPRSGSLCVYLIDENNDANCLLPYQNATLGCQQVVANKEYLFFSTDTDKEADEYTLNTQRSQEMNVVYIVYTPNGLTKAADRKAGKNWRKEQLPRQLSYEDFAKWLSKNQVKDQDMVVMTEVITIRK